MSSFSNWIFRSKEFSPVTSNEENHLFKRETYKDKFEINGLLVPDNKSN